MRSGRWLRSPGNNTNNAANVNNNGNVNTNGNNVNNNNLAVRPALPLRQMSVARAADPCKQRCLLAKAKELYSVLHSTRNLCGKTHTVGTA